MNRKGFTLMELLIVVVLIAILAGIGVPQYFNAVERERTVEAIGILTAIEQAQMRYGAVNDAYASDFANLDIDLPDMTNANRDNITGTTMTTKNFTYTLSNTKVIATRTDNSYYLELTFSTVDPEDANFTPKTLYCYPTGSSDICDIVDIPTKTNS